MNFDIQDLALIESIEQTGSFSAAAEKAYRTRSAITQHIKKLEDQLGFLMFDRSHYRPILTSEGRLFLERGRPLLRHLERLKQETRHIKQGWDPEFSIAIDDVVPTDELFHLIEKFRKIAPHVTIRVLREVLNGCWDALIEGRANLAIGVTGEPPENTTFGQRSLGTIEFIFAVAKDHPLTQLKPPIRPEALESYPTIIISDTSQSISKRSSGVVSYQPKIIVPTMAEKIKAQIFGLGIGYLPRLQAQPFLNTGDLVELDLTHHVKKKAYFKIAWQLNSVSPTLKWFLERFESEETLQNFLKEPKAIKTVLHHPPYE
ncbi:MAG: LysR family transcriptional regulator [Proteobacteria bacterium]|nr:LysR family transcriptional regulator [Pseudomonadota bacterium]